MFLMLLGWCGRDGAGLVEVQWTWLDCSKSQACNNVR